MFEGVLPYFAQRSMFTRKAPEAVNPESPNANRPPSVTSEKSGGCVSPPS